MTEYLKNLGCWTSASQGIQSLGLRGLRQCMQRGYEYGVWGMCILRCVGRRKLVYIMGYVDTEYILRSTP